MNVSDASIRSFIGWGFVAAFLTLHISFLPVDAEYQPLLFILLGLVLFIAGRREVSLAGPIIVGSCLLVAGVLHGVRGALDVSALIRCMLGPVFSCVGLLIIRYVPIVSLQAVVYVHVFIAFLGIIASGVTVEFLLALGLRGAQYGWNTFLASEPSYAALNLVSFLALFSVKDEKVLTGHVGLLSGLVLFSTMSLTGMVFGVVVILIWAMSNVRSGFGAVGLVGLVLIAGFLVMISNGGGGKPEVVGARLTVILESIRALDFLSLFSGETSGAWRFLSNGLALVGLTYAPFGTGSVALEAVFERSLEGVSSGLVGVILASDVYAGLQNNFVAATPFFNYITFGGFLAAVPLFGLVVVSAVRVSRKDIGLGSKVLFLACLVCGLVWQASLTSPGWWFLVGVGAQVVGSRKIAPRVS
jgi:hypothetical protein